MVNRFLAERLDVSVLVRTGEQADQFRAQGCEARLGDLMVPPTLTDIGEGIDQVIHLAANASLQTRNETELSVNVDGTRNLLEALDGSQTLKRFVLMSSIAAVAREPGSRLSKPLDATSEATPDTAYGRSKREAEQLVIQTFKEAPVDWVILRPALVYGPGQQARRRNERPYRTGDASRNGGTAELPR
jgi:nucleoside-diphosphate-sugar epimerase